MTAAMIDNLNRKGRRRFKAAQRRLERGEMGDRVIVNCLPLLDAIMDPRYGEGALELAVLAWGTASGHNTKYRECFVCCQPWSDCRRPILVCVVEWLKGSCALVSGLCGDCVSGGDISETVIKALKRELGFDPKSVQTIFPAGSA